MSSLADQLKRNAAGGDQRVAQAKSNYRPSYLYAPKQAASLSLEDIYGLGENGFTALCQITPTLAKLGPVFFEEASKHTDRALLSKEENAKLNKSIDQCLALLGPSVLVRPCGQVLEWLIRRYRINEFNVTSVLALMLPYHETPQFAQMLQLLHLENNPMLAAFIPVKKTLQPMTRHTLVKAMSRNSDLLQFVINLLPSAISNDAVHQTLVGFWAATLISYLDLRPSVTQEELSLFLPALFTAIKAKSKAETQLAAYIVVASLTSKSLLTPDAVETIINLISLKRTSNLRELASNDEAAITTVVSICQRQEELPSIPLRAFKHLVARSSFFQTLGQLHKAHNITFFLRPFCRTLAAQLLSEDEAASEGLDGVCNALLALEPCPALLVSAVFLDRLLTSKVGSSSQGYTRLLLTLSQLRQRHADEFSSAVQDKASDDAAGTAKAVEAVMATEHGSKLDQGARDADESVRLMAYQNLMTSASLSAEDAQAILKDPSPSVTALIASHAQSILAVVSVDKAIETCQPSIASEDTSRATLGHLTTFLTHAVLDKDAKAKGKVLRALWPRLLWTKAGKKSTGLIWEVLGKSPLAKSELKTCFPLASSSQQASDSHVQLNRSVIVALAAVCNQDSGLSQFLLSQCIDAQPKSLVGRDLAQAVATAYLALPTKEAHVHLGLAKNAQELSRQALRFQDAKTDFAVSGEGPSDQVLTSVSVKPKSPKTQSKLAACLIAQLALRFPQDASLRWNWLCGSEADADSVSKVTAARSLARTTFYLAHAVDNSQLRQSLFGSLFGHMLDADALSFLASLWIDTSETSSSVAAAALQTAAGLLSASKSKTSDFQLLLPTLTVPLSHEERSVRESALQAVDACRKQIQDTSAEARVYGSNQLYGTATQNIATLGQKDLTAYLAAIAANRTAIALSGNAVVDMHSSLGENTQEVRKPKKLQQLVATFWASSLLALPNGASFSKALSLFSAIKHHESVDLVLPALRGLFNEEAVALDAEAEDAAVRTMLSCYESSKSACFEKPSAEPLRFLRDVVQLQSSARGPASVRSRCLDLFKGKLFRKLSMASRLHMFEFLLQQSVSADTPADVSETLSEINLDPLTLASVLQNILRQLEDESKITKRARNSTAQSAGVQAQQMLTVILERIPFNRIEVDGKVFQLLYDCIVFFAGEQTLVSSDLAFIKQRLVLALSYCLERLSPQDISQIQDIRIAPLMDMLRTSPNPQTSQRILALVAQLTGIIPDQVIQNIIPLFTFMGSSVSQRDDAFAQATLTKVINATLPILAAKTKKTSATHAQLVTELHEVLRTLAGLVGHIPRYRRASVFSQFVNALGAQDFLAPVILMLLLQQSEDKGQKLPDVSERAGMCHALFDAFDAREQMTALSQLSSECHNIAFSKRGDASSAALQQTRVILAFLQQVLENRKLIARVDSARSHDSPVFDEGLQNVIKSVVILQDASSSAAFITASQEVIRRAARMLSPNSLCDSIIWLVGQSSGNATLGGFTLLRHALVSTKSAHGAQRREALDSSIQASLKQITTIMTSTAGVQNRTAIAQASDTLKLIAKHSSTSVQEGLVGVFKSLLPAASMSNLEEWRREHMLDVMPALLRNLGPRLLPQAETIASIARSAAFTEGSGRIAELGLEILQTMLHSLTNFISSFANDFLSVALHVSVASTSKGQALRSSLARHMPLKVLTPAFEHAWSDASKNAKTLGSLLGLMQQSIDHADTGDVLKQHKSLFNLLLRAWDWQGLESDEVHHKAVNAFVALTLKINESTFKPLLLRSIDWAFIETSNSTKGLERKVQMLSIMSALLQELKIVALPYLAHLLDPLSTLLEAFAAATSMDEASKKLWSRALDLLHLAMSLDFEGFWNEARLQHLLEPLVGQLQLPLARHLFDQHFRALMMAFGRQASPYEDLLKDINRALLERSRADYEEVTRVEALLTLATLWREVRDPLLPLVSQTTPFIVEALEERGEVEAAARDVVAAVEDCLGEESLADYMT